MDTDNMTDIERQVRKSGDMCVVLKSQMEVIQDHSEELLRVGVGDIGVMEDGTCDSGDTVCGDDVCGTVRQKHHSILHGL